MAQRSQDTPKDGGDQGKDAGSPASSALPPLPATRYPERQWWRKVPFIRTRPIEKPLIDSLGQVTPEAEAAWWSKLWFLWCHPLLKVGHTRPLMFEELYALPNDRHANVYADRLEKAWEKQIQKAEERKAKKAGKPKKGGSWLDRLRRIDGKKTSDDEDDKPSLVWALNEVAFTWFWMGGLFKLIGDLATITSPLFVRYIIYSINDTGDDAAYQQRRGFGLVIGLWLLLCIAVIGQVHGYYRGFTTGLLLRTALIHTIYRRGIKLSEKSKLRNGYGTAKLTSLMSADISRIDTASSQFHQCWTSLVQMAVCLILLCVTMGYSALPGFGLIIVMYPAQRMMVSALFRMRRRTLPFTDARVKAIVEAISGIRLVKTFAWESAILTRISQFRGREMAILRKRNFLRSINLAVSFTVPTIGAVISIICYVGTGHPLDPGVVFSALSYFLLIRIPLQLLPVALSAVADARTAIERLRQLLLQSPRDPDPTINKQLPEALVVKNASFVHHDDEDYEKLAQDSASQDEKKKPVDERLPTSTSLFIDDLTVQRGELCVIVGPVGSGKSSLLRALLGDLQCISSDELCLGDDIAYCPQTAWLRSSTVRENILFGLPYDQTAYDACIRRCCLTSDLVILPQGEWTVVGEKGISLSGGQKQRVSLARALYATMHQRPLCLLDDCFSALDAHVGATVMQRVILDSRKQPKEVRPTFVLVTHSLTLAKHADRIVYMDKGEIVEQGASYNELMQRQDGAFARLVQMTMSKTGTDSNEKSVDEETLVVDDSTEGETVDEAAKTPADQPKEIKDIMQKEERLVGSVNKRTYLDYLRMGYAPLTMPVFAVSILFYQGATILSPLWLRWWQQNDFPNLSLGGYMGTFAGLGVGQSFGLFCISMSFAMFNYFNSVNMHAKSAKRTLYAPMSFFDTTPQGRISHRFSRDIDAIDNQVGDSLRLFISTSVQAVGTVILVAIIIQYFLIIAAVIVTIYIWTGMFYRPTSRELRRLNNLLRSKIYEHFSESLSGLTTLRAYGVLTKSQGENATLIDRENRAYWLSMAVQRWLNIRLDTFGAFMVLGVGLLVVGLRGTPAMTPASAGVVLSSMVSAQSIFGQMIRQSAEIENNMNSIERVLHYANNVEQEAKHEKEPIDQKLRDQKWPSRGQITFENVEASYREGLPLALRGINLTVEAKQKIGIVGRTGAGKTTILSVLLRLIELSNGSIKIDDVDIKEVGLNILRRNISCISQDAVLFAGTLRYNLDPFGEYDDARLWWALKQARLAEHEGHPESATPVSEDGTKGSNEVVAEKVEALQTGVRRQLHLDMDIALDGSNLSQGQRALVSIARALVKEAKIVILDEATASIDGVLDGEVQKALAHCLRDATVLTVAHRLDTVIASSDKICVVDAGKVAQFDRPEVLFNDQPTGIFRQLCQSAGITASDIESTRRGDHGGETEAQNASEG